MLHNIPLSQVVTPASVNSGTIGWDAAISQFIRDRSGRMAFQLLSRVENAAVSGSASNILVCPAGYQCLPILCVARLQGGTVGSPQQYEMYRGDSLTASNSWAANSAGGSYVSFAKLTLTNPLLIWSRPDSTLFADLAPEAVPMLDGDDPTLNTLKIRRQAGNTLTLGLSIYGMAWPKSD